MRKVSVSVLLLCFMNFCLGQQDLTNAKESITIMFYNVENLFDINNDPEKADEEFLPVSKKQWSSERYTKKITDLSRVISEISPRKLPDIAGFAEVENKSVIEDLIASQRLRKAGYMVVHFDSRDERGIDVALILKKDVVELLDSRAIPVNFDKSVNDVTRDILYARCRIKGDRIIHIFVNHWPSRSPGQEESEMKRISAALALRREVDNILNYDNEAAILIMGDFNDEPTNRSLFTVLNATNKLKNRNYRDLYNLMYDSHNSSGEGTLLYRDEWQMFDQIIVSPALLSKGGGYFIAQPQGKIFRDAETLIKDPSTGKQILNRTYGGDNYLGGVSDHLPVYVILTKE